MCRDPDGRQVLSHQEKLPGGDLGEKEEGRKRGESKGYPGRATGTDKGRGRLKKVIVNAHSQESLHWRRVVGGWGRRVSSDFQDHFHRA